jgi:hypothetical protein
MLVVMCMCMCVHSARSGLAKVDHSCVNVLSFVIRGIQIDYLGTETAAVELPEEVSAPATFRYFNMGPASIVG